MLHARGDREALKRVYPDIEEFWADISQAYREEIAGLYDAGCRYLQIDDTTIAMMGYPNVQEKFRQAGDDPHHAVAAYAEAINRAIGDMPDDMAVSHLPRQLQEHVDDLGQLRLRRRDGVL